MAGYSYIPGWFDGRPPLLGTLDRFADAAVRGVDVQDFQVRDFDVGHVVVGGADRSWRGTMSADCGMSAHGPVVTEDLRFDVVVHAGRALVRSCGVDVPAVSLVRVGDWAFSGVSDAFTWARVVEMRVWPALVAGLTRLPHMRQWDSVCWAVTAGSTPEATHLVPVLIRRHADARWRPDLGPGEATVFGSPAPEMRDLAGHASPARACLGGFPTRAPELGVIAPGWVDVCVDYVAAEDPDASEGEEHAVHPVFGMGVLPASADGAGSALSPQWVVSVGGSALERIQRAREALWPST